MKTWIKKSSNVYGKLVGLKLEDMKASNLLGLSVGSISSRCETNLCLDWMKILKNSPFLVWRDPGVSLKGQTSRLPGQPCWLYAYIALQQHSPLPSSFTHLKTGWAQDAWLQWSYENWYIHLDISRWQNCPFSQLSCNCLCLNLSIQDFMYLSL